jgi:hypothetical protein
MLLKRKNGVINIPVYGPAIALGFVLATTWLALNTPTDWFSAWVIVPALVVLLLSTSLYYVRWFSVEGNTVRCHSFFGSATMPMSRHSFALRRDACCRILLIFRYIRRPGSGLIDPYTVVMEDGTGSSFMCGIILLPSELPAWRKTFYESLKQPVPAAVHKELADIAERESQARLIIAIPFIALGIPLAIIAVLLLL